MIERLKIFVGNSDRKHNSLNRNATHYKLLIQAMKFISQKPDNMLEGLVQMYQSVFEFFSIPIVFYNYQWKTYDNDNVLPDSYFYQIKLLFNEWDSNKTTYPIIELLLKADYKIKSVKVPRFDIIISSVKAKTVTNEKHELNEDNNENEKHENQDNNINKYVEKEEIKNDKNDFEIMRNKTLRYYKERQKRLNNDENKSGDSKSKTTGKSNEKSKIELSKDSFLFWDFPSKSEVYDNGIIRKNITEKDKTINFKLIGPNNSNLKDFPVQQNSNQLNNEISDDNSARELAIKMLNSHTKNETELCKIFIYNETEKKWEFDSQSFQSFSKSRRLNGMKTPLVFVVNSDEQNVIDLNSHFIHGLYPKLDKEDQIFVYALCDKTLTMLSMKNEFSDQIKSLTKPIFLQIHVPKSKENESFIQTALSQMICYLICISSVSIVILKDQISQYQIEYYQKILNISKFAAKNNSNEEQEENNENENEGNGIIYKQNNSIYLINIPKVEYNERTAVNYHNHSAYTNIINYSNNNDLLLIDVNNVETYDHFFDTLSSYILNNNMNFADIEQDFNSFYGFEICSKYITMRLLPDWKTVLKDTIMSRYLSFIIRGETKSLEYLSNVLAIIYNEITSFTPRFDLEFTKEYQSIILSLRKNTSQMNRKKIAKELSLSAEYDISFIFGLLEKEDFYTKDQLNTFRRNHEIFLTKEYYEIVKLSIIESMFDLVFEDNFDLVALQVTNDREKLNDKFKVLLDTLSKMKIVNESSAQENAKKSTNYMLKETENLREIKVAVQIKKDLTSIIEQDF